MLLLGGLPFGLAGAQEPMSRLLDTFGFSYWGRDHGMPEVAVVFVDVSSDGFVWCLTPNHLLAFDGQHFEDYGALDTTGAAAVPYPILFRGWSAEKNGTPWIHGQRGAMWRGPDGWRRLDLTEGYRSILAMPLDIAGRFWAVTEDGVWRVEQNQLVPVARSTVKIMTAVADPKGGLRIGSTAGLFHFAGEDFTPVVAGEYGSLDEVVCMERGRTIDWIICARQGLILQKGAEWKRVPLPFASSQVTRVLEDDAGAIWVGTKQGLYRYADGIWSELSARDVANPVNVLSLVTDAENRIWVGTSDGLFCLRKKLVRTLLVNPRQGRQPISSLAVLDGTNLWAGSLSDGLLRAEGSELKPVTGFGLPARAMVTALAPADQGTLWVGTLGDHLFLLSSNKATRIVEAPRSPQSAREITVVRAGESNRLWVGTWQGVFQLSSSGSNSVAKMELEPVPMRNTGSRSLSPVMGRVSALATEQDGSVWLGYEGLWVLRRYRNPMTVVYGYGWGLPGPNVRTFFRDRDGRLWAGTSLGLGRLADNEWQKVLREHNLFAENQDERARDRAHWQTKLRQKLLWQSMGAAEGLVDADIRQIIEDDFGRFWLGTRKGIQVCKRSQLEAVLDGKAPFIEGQVLGVSEGMASEECTLGASPGAVRDALGRLYFATMDGVVVVDPAAISPPTNRLPVFLQQVVAGDSVVFRRDALSPISISNQAVRQPDNPVMSLPLGQRNVEFVFSTPDYDSPTRVHFRWKLDGIDPDWSEPRTERRASYPRLSPGDYAFRVMVGANGVWRESEAPFRFRVRPYPHEMPAVQLVAGAFLTVAVGLGAWRLERLRSRRRMRQLEHERALERERTRISRDLHDELGVGLTEIGLLGDVVAATPPSEANANSEVAGEISGRARGLVAALDEIVWAINPANDNSLALGDYFSRYAQNLLQRAGLRCQIDVASVSRDARVSAEMRHQLFLAFKEALNNVLTHARATEVCIGIALENSCLTIRVADNGSGIGPAATTGSPDGLHGMRERLTQIGGACEIRSVPSGGTTVIFTLPVHSL